MVREEKVFFCCFFYYSIIKNLKENTYCRAISHDRPVCIWYAIEIIVWWLFIMLPNVTHNSSAWFLELKRVIGERYLELKQDLITAFSLYGVSVWAPFFLLHFMFTMCKILGILKLFILLQFVHCNRDK